MMNPVVLKYLKSSNCFRCKEPAHLTAVKVRLARDYHAAAGVDVIVHAPEEQMSTACRL